MAPLIILKGLKKEYETAVALRGIDICVEKGEWISIVGPSGSGKSTLLNLMGGLDYPSTGSIHVDGVDLSALDEEKLSIFRRERIGFIFQQSHLIPYLTAIDNVMLAQYFHSIPDRKEVEDALNRVGLGHRLHHRPSQLSGGEQQRVCIARALINSPSLLLADEPTGNLDRSNTKNVLELLKTLHTEEHFTIILVTHDPFVSQWADRVLCMEDGRISSDECIRLGGRHVGRVALDWEFGSRLRADRIQCRLGRTGARALRQWSYPLGTPRIAGSACGCRMTLTDDHAENC